MDCKSKLMIKKRKEKTGQLKTKQINKYSNNLSNQSKQLNKIQLLLKQTKKQNFVPQNIFFKLVNQKHVCSENCFAPIRENQPMAPAATIMTFQSPIRKFSGMFCQFRFLGRQKKQICLCFKSKLSTRAISSSALPCINGFSSFMSKLRKIEGPTLRLRGATSKFNDLLQFVCPPPPLPRRMLGSILFRSPILPLHFPLLCSICSLM